MNQRLLWVVFIIVLMSVVCPICYYKLETTRWYTDISFSSSHTSESASQLVSTIAKSKGKGLRGFETTLFGWVIEGEYDWADAYPTRYPGLPGGKYGLIGLFFIVGAILAFVPCYLRSKFTTS